MRPKTSPRPSGGWGGRRIHRNDSPLAIAPCRDWLAPPQPGTADLSLLCSAPFATNILFGFTPCQGQMGAPAALGKEKRPWTTSPLPWEEFMKPVTPVPGSQKGPASHNCQPLSPGGPSFSYFPLNGVSLGSPHNTATIKHKKT